MNISITDTSVQEIMINGTAEHEGYTYCFYGIFHEHQEGRKLVLFQITEVESDNNDTINAPVPGKVMDKIYEFLTNEDEKYYKLKFNEEFEHT